MRQKLLLHVWLGVILNAALRTGAVTTTTSTATPIAFEESVDWDIFDDFVPFSGQLNEEFDCNLFKQLAANTNGNLLISPLSVKLLLTMMYEGAYGETKTELQQVLQLPDSPQATRERAMVILDSLKVQNKNYLLDFGSRMYLRSDIGPRQRFAAIMTRFYQTELFPLFPAQGAAPINKWVADITKGKIKSIVSEDDVKNAALLLINALYFKGTWRSEFPKNQTAFGNFQVTPKKKTTVEYMARTGRYFYLNSPDIKASFLRIPYKGHKFSMFFVLPDKQDGLSEVISRLNPKTLRSSMWLMDEVEVNVTIPKFKFDVTSHLTDALRKMGLKTIFSEDASLPGIARGVTTLQKLMVSNILQKTGLELNEEGTTVYAATEIVLINKFDVPLQYFKADHPFVFFIQDETTGAILFIGKVEDPLEVHPEVATY